MIVPVSDASDSRLDRFRWRERQLASRTDRAETVGAGLFVAEGDLVVDRALAAGCEPVALLCDERLAVRYGATLPGIDVFVGDTDLRRDVTGLGVPLGAAGLFRRPALVSPDGLVEGSRWIVAVEAVDNPTNLGAIVRTAAGLGFDALIMDSTSADPLARRALRVSMGTAFGLPFARLTDDDSLPDLLSRHTGTSYALTPDGSATDVSRVDTSTDERTFVLLGSERTGLASRTMQGATVSVRIPMHRGVDSLNVAAAAAIALHMLGPNGGR